MGYFERSTRTEYSEQNFSNFTFIGTIINRAYEKVHQISVNYFTSWSTVIYWLDIQGWEGSWERENLLPHILAYLLRMGKMDSSLLGFPVVTETLLPSCSSQQYGWNSKSSTPCCSFSISSFGWRRASSKKLEVWLQGHRMSETDCAELILWYFLNVLFSLHRDYHSMAKVFFMGNFYCLFVCFAQTWE